MSASIAPTAESRLVELLISLIELRDPCCSSSSLTRLVADVLGRALSLGPGDLHNLNLASLLRDITRAVVPIRGTPVDSREERVANTKRVRSTVALLSSVGISPDVLRIVRHHQERWDGSGYPDGLARDDIPLPSRILAVADAFTAMLSPLPNSLPISVAQAMDAILECAGRRHDPAVVRALARSIAPGPESRLNFLYHRNVLIAHPDRHIAAVLGARLRTSGYISELVPNRAAVGPALDRNPTPALILSAEMPGCEPLELIRALRRSKRFHAIDILVTSVRSAETRAQLLDGGADACFPSDIAVEEISATLNSYVRRRSRPAAMHPKEKRAPASHILRGDLKNFPLAWVLQSLHYDGRTASVRVHSLDGQVGVLRLKKGELVHAKTRRAQGDDAVRLMLSWTNGRFAADAHGEPVVEHNVTSTVMSLLLTSALAEDHAIVDDRRAEPWIVECNVDDQPT